MKKMYFFSSSYLKIYIFIYTNDKHPSMTKKKRNKFNNNNNEWNDKNKGGENTLASF